MTVTTASPDASPAAAVIVADPLPVAVTRPAPSTVPTRVSLLDHDTDTPASARPSWSRTSADSCAVWSNAASTTASGVTVIDVGTAAATTTSAPPDTPAVVAVATARPGATPVTSPESSITATVVSLDAHVNTASLTARPFASVATAENRTVSPSTTGSAEPVTVTVLTVCRTVSAALPDASPAAAVIVADPLPVAVASPAPSTVPTRVSLLDHDTEVLGITAPCWSRTSAANATVVPRAESSAVAGVTVTVAGRGGTGAGSGRGGTGSGSVLPSPHERVGSTIASKPAATNRNRWSSTMATRTRLRGKAGQRAAPKLSGFAEAIRVGLRPATPIHPKRGGDAGRRVGRPARPGQDPVARVASPPPADRKAGAATGSGRRPDARCRGACPGRSASGWGRGRTSREGLQGPAGRRRRSA